MQAVFQLSHSEHARSSIPLLGDSDPFMVSAAIETIGRPAHVPALLAALRQPTTPSLRIGILLALRRSGSSTAVQAISEFLADVDPGVRRTAIQWIAEEQVTEFAHRLQAAATKEPVTRELFESWLAARSLLENRTTKDPGKNTVSETMVASILEDSKQPAQFHVLALRMLRHDHPLLTAGRLAAFVSSKEPGLQIEAMRTLIMRADSDSQTLLRKLALDDRLPLVERAKAVAGLSHSAKDEDTIRVLETAAKSTELKRDAERSLTDREPDAKARSLSEWRPLLESVGSAAAGERLFYHAKGPGCFKCHRINGRGGIAGPDLSLIGRSLSRDKMIESIVTPSKEIAPAFTTWRITTVDGRERIAMIVGETHDSKFTIADSLGVVTQIHRNQIEERTPVPVSIMPENLPQLMTPDEFRDLLAFLMERK
jgi:putative heme-binding domain-containing protein